MNRIQQFPFDALNLQVVMAFFFLAGLMLSGCSEKSPGESLNVTVLPPDQFYEASVIWRRADCSEADNLLLNRYFAANSEVLDRMCIEGEMIAFHGPSNDRRFYWLIQGAQTVHWFCLHYERSRFHTTEGTGNPFSNACVKIP